MLFSIWNPFLSTTNLINLGPLYGFSKRKTSLFRNTIFLACKYLSLLPKNFSCLLTFLPLSCSWVKLSNRSKSSSPQKFVLLLTSSQISKSFSSISSDVYIKTYIIVCLFFFSSYGTALRYVSWINTFSYVWYVNLHFLFTNPWTITPIPVIDKVAKWVKAANILTTAVKEI